ncbi:MAG: alpha/beta hydrolase family protein [Rhodobacterales bacterium]|jgi:predicted dienelactone hydrolase
MTVARTRTTLSSLILSLVPLGAMADQTGLMELSLPDPTGGRATTGFFWYPAADPADTVLALGNAVWEPIRVAPDADPVPGSYPLVVLSHGMFGNARNQAWLAEGLVAAGFIVAAADHPGTSTFQRDPDQRRELWERPRDVSRVIDTVLADPRIGPAVDANRIYMAGHSLGGFTAMLLAGARFDPGRTDAFCTSHPDDRVCTIFNDWGVAKTPEDRVAMSGDLSDPRIRAFAVFDLGGTQSLSPESLGAVTRSVLVYGAPVAIEGLDLDVESRALVAALPASLAIYHEPATMAHFDFLGVCTERAIEILQQEEPDDVYVCEDGREDRRAEHRQIIAEVTDFFQAN